MTADLCPFCGYAKNHHSDAAYACGTWQRPNGVYVVTEGCVRAILYAKGHRYELELPDEDSDGFLGDDSDDLGDE